MLTNFTTSYYTTVMNSAVGPITEFKSENNYKHWSMQTIMSSSSNHYCCRRFRACCKLSYCRFTPFPLCFLFHNVFHYRAKPSAVYRCISSRIQKCNMPFMLLFLLLFLHQFSLLFFHLLFSPLLLLVFTVGKVWLFVGSSELFHYLCHTSQHSTQHILELSAIF